MPPFDKLRASVRDGSGILFSFTRASRTSVPVLKKDIADSPTAPAKLRGHAQITVRDDGVSLFSPSR